MHSVCFKTNFFHTSTYLKYVDLDLVILMHNTIHVECNKSQVIQLYSNIID